MGQVAACRALLTAKADNLQQAQARLERLDENIRLVESGRLEIPAGADIAAFLLGRAS